MKKKGILLVNLAIAIVFGALLFSGGAALTTRIISGYQSDQLKLQCTVLDKALESWSIRHKKIQESSIVYGPEKVSYRQQGSYPESLNELGELQTLGYFSEKINIKQFRYMTRDSGVEYHLSVQLPSGELYTSQGSAY